MKQFAVLLIVYSFNCVSLYQITDDLTPDSANQFPNDFLFGAATSAFQIEGASNISNKGECIWNRLTRTRPDLIADGSNADVAARSYYKYKDDVRLVKEIGANSYRISLSWPRILPNGFSNHISKDGVKYYNDLIDEMIKNKIMPMVTIYHWELPQKLQDLGGWTNPYVIDWLEDYARVAFTLFGDRVKLWATINEPVIKCRKGYGSFGKHFAPAINQSGIADYMCGHHVLLAHAKVYHLYQREFLSKQQGKVGIVLSCGWYEPKDSSCPSNRKAAERAYQFDVGWFAHPLFSEQGDYPQIMKTRIAARSKKQKFSRSRLPVFTKEQIEEIKYSSDFLGINYYTATGIQSDEKSNVFGFDDDAGIKSVRVKSWPGVTWVKNTPWGLGKLLRRIRKDYNKIPPIYITENGYGDFGGLHDVERVTYIHDHLQELLRVIKDGVNVKGYIAWSLMDNFEWAEGYTVKFGLFMVDFKHSDRPRKPKLSSKFVAEVYKTRKIPKLSKYTGMKI